MRPNRLVSSSLEAVVLLCALLAVAGCGGGEEGPQAPPANSGYRYTSQEAIETLAIVPFEVALEAAGLELSPEGEALVAEGRALVSELPLSSPILHPNGVVEVWDGLFESFETHLNDNTSANLPWGLRKFETQVAFGLFNCAFVSPVAPSLPLPDSRYAR